MINVIMINVTMLSVIVTNAIILSAIMINVIMLNVVAPKSSHLHMRIRNRISYFDTSPIIYLILI